MFQKSRRIITENEREDEKFIFEYTLYDLKQGPLHQILSFLFYSSY